ncbi:MAG TPA: response regulator [Rubrivivax sp.]|nr:response regulator [Rubrivivax sp.]
MAQGRLLVLDDEATVGQILVMAAQAAGFEARCCEDLASFVEALMAWPPTHVVLDLGIPDTTPTQVLQALADARCRAQVIICSGAAPADVQDALALVPQMGLRAGGVLAKPFRLAELRALLAAAG